MKNEGSALFHPGHPSIVKNGMPNDTTHTVDFLNMNTTTVKQTRLIHSISAKGGSNLVSPWKNEGNKALSDVGVGSTLWISPLA